jgi:hypothetical protein
LNIGWYAGDGQTSNSSRGAADTTDVLYSFLRFLIQVLGGEEALILMLKDKSPTRGVHMWGLHTYCGLKPCT